MVDVLVGVHPVATAWGFLSIGFEVVKNQRDKQAVVKLYTGVISVYEVASKDNVLQQRGYAQKNGIGHLFAMDISGQAETSLQAFPHLNGQLSMGFAWESRSLLSVPSCHKYPSTNEGNLSRVLYDSVRRRDVVEPSNALLPMLEHSMMPVELCLQ
ncbi:hypothetical protein ARMSODRAFT_1022424 [Armillaria solidipes]|uniref:Uncharacterized protein n=1 Tax=Armillaria solidipes TaxID=1076256 RepID=A0A2H3BL80_9AGAR|nr:hypothetical protein ARMSODRAFT_1022424 [Armillaria solidipes]